MAMTQAFRNYLASNSSFKIAHLIRIELSSSTKANPLYYYVTDADRDIQWDGNTYGKGRVVSIGNSILSSNLSSYTTKLILAGENQDELNRAISDSATASYLGKEVLVHRAYFDDNDDIIPADDVTLGPINYLTGSITELKIEDDPSSSATITYSIANQWRDFTSIKGRITTDNAHRALVDGVSDMTAIHRPEYATDLGFTYGGTTIDTIATYQTTVTHSEMRSKKNWLGIRKYYTHTWTTVENQEVQLLFHLAEKRLPVVYGVRKVPGIPIFADTLRDDASKVVVVYAVCEGQVEGFLDVVVDGETTICINQDELESSEDGSGRFCVGRASDSTTINQYDTNITGSGTGVAAEDTDYTIDYTGGDIMTFRFHNGGANQLADTYLANADLKLNTWGADYKCLDTAYVVCTFDISGSRSSVPDMEFIVSGILPTGNGLDRINPAHHLKDYLSSTRYGMGLTNLDQNSFTEVANYASAEDTSYAASFVSEGYLYIGKDSILQTPQLMEQNLLIDSDSAVVNNVKSLVIPFGLILNLVDNKYTLRARGIDYNTKLELSSGDVIGAISFTDSTDKSKLNEITTSIEMPLNGWNSVSIPYYDSTYLTLDNSVAKSSDLSMPNVTNYYTARTWAIRTLQESRYNKTLDIVVSQRYIYLAPGDLVLFTHERYGWVSKKFRVSKVTKRSTGPIGLSLEEYEDSIYNVSAQSDTWVPTYTPPTSVNPPTSVLWSPFSGASQTLNGTLSWLPSTSPDIVGYYIEWGEGTRGQVTPSNDKTKRITYSIEGFPDGTYTFNISAVNASNTTSRVISITVDVTSGLPTVDSALNLYITNTEAADLVLNWDAQIDYTLGTYVNTYTVEVYDTTPIVANLLHIDTVTGTSFTYTQAQNISDYATKNAGAVGVNRTLAYRVQPLGFTSWSYL